MRILALSDVPPFVIGGAEMQTLRLATSWVSMGHSVAIAGHRILESKMDGIQLIRLPVFYSGGRLLRGITYFLSLANYLINNQKTYDLLYCRFLGEAAISISILKNIKLIKLPLVAVPAAAGTNDNADAAFLGSLPGSHAIVKILNRQCDCVNFITPGIRESLANIGIQPFRTTSIPNGVPLPALRASGPETHVKNLLFVGRLVHQKGLDILFIALARLLEHRIDFELRLVGDGPERSRLECLSEELGLQEKVLFLGEQPHDKMQDELIETHLFILPSRYEGLSNAALEALSYGIPCVVTKCNGIDNYFSDDIGWVCNLESHNELFDSLFKALRLNPSKWLKMSDACRSLIANKFAIDKIAQKNIQIFEEITAYKN